MRLESTGQERTLQSLQAALGARSADRTCRTDVTARKMPPADPWRQPASAFGPVLQRNAGAFAGGRLEVDHTDRPRLFSGSAPVGFGKPAPARRQGVAMSRLDTVDPEAEQAASSDTRNALDQAALDRPTGSRTRSRAGARRWPQARQAAKTPIAAGRFSEEVVDRPRHAIGLQSVLEGLTWRKVDISPSTAASITIACDDGEEDHLRPLGRPISTRRSPIWLAQRGGPVRRGHRGCW